MIVYNKIIPFNGYKAFNFFGIIFARSLLNEVAINHEKIHTALMKELLFIFFYIWYIIEWLVLYFKYKKEAYDHIKFEKEAYKYQRDRNYLKNRPYFNFLVC